MKLTVIDGTQHAKCELCGKVDELRPYGPKGEFVCFDCMMKDEAAAKKRFAEITAGTTVIIK